MEKVKVTFELTKDYIKGIMSIMGDESEIPTILDTIGDNVEIDIDEIAKYNQDLAKAKIMLVSLIVCKVAIDKGL